MDPQFKAHFSRDAALFPHMLDIPTDRVLLSRLGEAGYKAASFLDQRILSDQLTRETRTWDELAAIDIPKGPAPHYIFHIGHVGSTLISRLLGERPDVLSLREPHILRSFAEIAQIKTEPQSPWSPEKYETRLSKLSSWLARGFRNDQRSLIKASSFVSEIAEDLIDEQTQALFLYVPLENYLASIFAGEGSRQEAQQLAGNRIMRLTRRIGKATANLWELSEGQIIALGWLTEMLTLNQSTVSKSPAQILWQDFDAFLAAPASTLADIAHHLNIEMGAHDAAALINGPIMRTYSKAPEHEYSPTLRRDLLRQARSDHNAEIEKTLDWVTSLANSHTEIADLLAIRQTDTRQKD